MTPGSYESSIVEAMLRWVDAKIRGDESTMASAMLEAQGLASRIRSEREPEQEAPEDAAEPSEEKEP